MSQQDAINDLENDILHKEQFFDDLIPDFSQYFDHHLDKYKERYIKLYENCDDEQIVVERLNTQLHKIQIDDYMNDEMPQTSKQMMTFFVNYIINYLRIIVDKERQENLSYFIFYENQQILPINQEQIDEFKVIEEIQSLLIQIPEQKFKTWIFKQRRDIKFKYLTQIFHINDKWMIQIYNIMSEVVYFYSFQQENTYQSIFQKYLDQYLVKPLNEKNIFIYKQNLNRLGDNGDLVFWVCFKLFVQNISVILGKVYFTKIEIELLRPRIIWLFLKVLNTKVKKIEIPIVLFDEQKEYQEQLRQAKQKQQIKTQLDAEKKEEQLRKFAELVAKEEAEQERMKQIQINVLAEKELNENMKNKLAKFNVRIPGSKRKSQLEGWLVGKVAFPADHHHYNLTVDIPSLQRQRIYMRDKNIISGDQQYKSIVDRPLILNLPPNGSNIHQNMLPSIKPLIQQEAPEDQLRQKWINAQESKYDRGEPILPKKYYEEPYDEDKKRIRSNYPKQPKQEQQMIQQKSKAEQLQKGIQAMEQSIQQYQVNEQQLNELMKQNYQYSQSVRFLPQIQ